MNPEAVFFRWATASDGASPLAEFFIQNVSTEYISHGEMLDGRADGVGSWSKRLSTVLIEEFSGGCRQLPDPICGETRLGLAESSDGGLLGIAYVGLAKDASTPFAILYDLVLKTKVRSQGLGRRFLTWIEAGVRSHGIRRVFLESGITNGSAHAFFESSGFAPVSLSMMKSL